MTLVAATPSQAPTTPALAADIASTRPGRRWLGVAWAIVVALALGLGVGERALIDPDEGRSAVTALAMARSGDFLVPHLNGLPHLDKPILYYAAAALSMRWLGANELAARLPSLLAAWGTLALVIWFSAHLFGRPTAWVAGTAFVTAPLTVVMARTAIFDSLLSLFMVLALMAFYRAVESDGGSAGFLGERGWNAIAWAAMAFGVLTKGPVALAVPLLVAVPYALLRHRSRVIWHPSGWILHLAIVLPWVFAVEAAVPGFLRYALVTETWSRVTTNELERGGPIWYFLPYLFAGCFPWILVVAGSLRERWRTIAESERRPLLFLGLWMTIPLVFFSLSQSKRPQYILPIVVACALLTAFCCAGGTRPPRGLRAAAIGSLGFGLLLLVAGLVRIQRFEAVPELARIARPVALELGALLVAAAVVAVALRARPRVALAILSLPMAALPVITAPVAGEISRRRSGLDLAAAIEPHLGKDTTIAGIDAFSPSLAFYLERPIEVSTATGVPLRSNYIAHAYDDHVGRDGSTLREASGWRLSLAQCPHPTIFLLEQRDKGERMILEAADLPVLYDDAGFVAMGPCRPSAVDAPVETATGAADGATG